MRTAANAELIVDVVKSVFSGMLDIDLSVVELEGAPAGERLTASVYIEGEWNGAVLLECDRRQACEFTGRMLAIDPPDSFNADVCDVVGEIANVIGGNIKSHLSPEDRLSLPSVIHGHDFEISVCESQLLQKVAFEFYGGHFWVKILGKAGPKSQMKPQ